MKEEEIWKISNIDEDIMVSNKGRYAIMRYGDYVNLKGKTYLMNRLLKDAFPDMVTFQDIESLPGEEWRCTKYSSEIQVSNMGRVKRLRTCGMKQYYKLMNMPKRGANGVVYNCFTALVNRKRVQIYCARLVYETFVRDIPDGYRVIHLDGNKLNDRLDNLSLKSRSQFEKYRLDNVIGDKNKVRVLDLRFNGLLTYQKIADKCNLDIETVRHICKSYHK